MEREFYSNGKLLLSGEYAILDGALGLAVPTKFGQSLKVIPTDSGVLEWTSFDQNNSVWFQATFDLKQFISSSEPDNAVGKTLTQLLLEAQRQNPDFLCESYGIQVETKLDFPREWGLGSSSTLINNIAQWAQIDAYQLLWNAFGGSGYDIACAQHDHPLTYQLVDNVPQVNKVTFSPPFKDNLYFVYLNKKQSSKGAIANYRAKEFDTNTLVSQITGITKKMIASQSLEEFEILMIEHEKVLSDVLGIPPIKSSLFSDYPGTIKSLGAWGGDFILATAQENPEVYFQAKGYDTVLAYNTLILS